ncbi:hypothetical protein BGZ82_004449 [Podila clonocystis]|nr:hypothetical protein BGZ82_004449 [Podila clonocystis]
MSRTGGQRKAKDDRASEQNQHAQAQTQTQTQAHTQQYRDSSPASSQASTRRSSIRTAEPAQEDEHDSDERKEHDRRFKIASVILFICILSFVLQTELTKFVQTSMGYHKPYLILWFAHSFWSIVLPAQFVYTTYLARSRPRNLTTFRDRVDYFARLIRQSTSNLYHRKVQYNAVDIDSPRASMSPAPSSPISPSSSGVSTPSQSTVVNIPVSHASTFTSREKSVLNKYLFWVVFGMTTLFMVPSYLWYFCVNLTSMANLTAIYNTACFFAYLFSILMLKEKIVRNKVLAVVLSLIGVAIISLTSRGSSDSDDEDSAKASANKVGLLGDILSLVGAALYGFEEVMYKKYSSPKVHSVTFANTMTGLMGAVTCLILWVPIPILHFIGHEVFELPTKNEFLSVLMIATLGLVYNGCFMIVVSQTSPVFAAVGVMATIPLVALTDWAVFGDKIGWGNMVGGISILAGFAILIHRQSNPVISRNVDPGNNLNASSSHTGFIRNNTAVLQPIQETRLNIMTPAAGGGGPSRANPFSKGVGFGTKPAGTVPTASHATSNIVAPVPSILANTTPQPPANTRTIFKFGGSGNSSVPSSQQNKCTSIGTSQQASKPLPLRTEAQAPSNQPDLDTSFNADDFMDADLFDFLDEDSPSTSRPSVPNQITPPPPQKPSNTAPAVIQNKPIMGESTIANTSIKQRKLHNHDKSQNRTARACSSTTFFTCDSQKTSKGCQHSGRIGRKLKLMDKGDF